MLRTKCPAVNPATTSLTNATVQQIVSAVSQAVLASLNVPGSSSTAPETTSNTQVAEVPLVASHIGKPNTADATMQGPVASAIHSLSGEHLVHVSPPASSGLSKFNSVSIPIDAQVNVKLKAKIWANEHFDFALLLSAGSGDTRYHLSVSSQSGFERWVR